MPAAPSHTSHRLELAALLLVLLCAAGFRLYRLAAIPPGLTHDEADVGYFALAIFHGQPANVSVPYGYAYQPLVHYTIAGLMHLVGPNYLALRLNFVFFGLALVLFSFLWLRRAAGRAPALLTAGLLATGYWTVSTSRQGNTFLPVAAFTAVAAWALWKMMNAERGTMNGVFQPDTISTLNFRSSFFPRSVPSSSFLLPASFFLIALSLGLSFYAYEASLAAFAAFTAFAAYLTLFHRRTLPARALLVLWLALAAALLIGLPHLLDPASWGRTDTLSEPIRQLRNGQPGPLIANVFGALGTLTFKGDPLVTYNLPGRPVFDPLLGLFFFVGLGVAGWRWRSPLNAFALLVLGFGLAPSLVVGAFTSTVHSVAAQVSAYFLVALGALSVWKYIAGRVTALRQARWQALGFAALLLWSAGVTVRDYFGRWAKSDETRAAYFYTLNTALDFARTFPSTSLSISSPFPEPPLDPFIGGLRLRPDQSEARWFDGRVAILIPERSGALLVPASAPLNEFFVSLLNLSQPDRHYLPSGIDPYFDIYPYPTAPARAGIMRSLDAFPETDVGGAVRLLGWQAVSPSPAPGRILELATFWLVADPSRLGLAAPDAYSPQARIFLQLLGPDGAPVAQQDTLDAPVSSWQSGDLIVQLHRLQLSADLLPGEYTLITGLYTLPDIARLPIEQNGQPVGDYVTLGHYTLR